MGKFFVELIHMKFPKWFYQVQQTSWETDSGSDEGGYKPEEKF